MTCACPIIHLMLWSSGKQSESILFISPPPIPVLVPTNFYTIPTLASRATHLLPSTECAIPASQLFSGPGGQFHLGEGGEGVAGTPGGHRVLSVFTSPQWKLLTVNIRDSQAVLWLLDWAWLVHRTDPRGWVFPPSEAASTNDWRELVDKCPVSLSPRWGTAPSILPYTVSRESPVELSPGCPMVMF